MSDEQEQEAAIERGIADAEHFGATDPGPVPEQEDADPFGEGVRPLDTSRPVDLDELVAWLLDATMNYTNAVELMNAGQVDMALARLARTYNEVSPTLRGIAATMLPSLFPEGVEVEGIAINGPFGAEPS